MNETSFIERKLQQYISEVDEMDEQKVNQVMHFILTTNKHHFDEMSELIKRTNENNDILLKRIEEMESDIKFYQSFIKDNNLSNRYKFFCKQKGVI